MHEKVSVLDPVMPTMPVGTTVEPKKPLLKQFPKSAKKMKMQLIAIGLVIVLAGVGTGYALAGNISTSSTPQVASGDKKATGAGEEGVEDATAFKDTAEGVLEEGGIDGEGTYHLVRDGGPSKYVYLTSTVLNLDAYIGKKVQVWGETISGRKAGWLMDVGKIKSLE